MKRKNGIKRKIILGILILVFIVLILPDAIAESTTQEYTVCDGCHPKYTAAIKAKQHANTDYCLICHKGGYDTSTHTVSGYIGYIVNEATCNQAQCHSTTSGVAQRPVYESHGNKYYGPNKADCTQCHFANTTRLFPLNATNSLYEHNHNFTVEYNFYNYNLYGMPLSTNGGAGKGMFPYYTCTLTCHGTGRYSIENEAIGWNQSAHARSRHGDATYDSKNSCAKCKSPPNYNVSAPSSAPIAQADWQGIQCRICHNLHNDTYSGRDAPAFPLAFYNSTLSSTAGSPVYEKVVNSTELCEKCHTGTTHDSKFAGTHKDTVGFGCADCHANSTFNDLTHKFEVKNTTSGVTGCEVCHKTEDHTFKFTSLHINKVTCEACHDKTVGRNASGYAVSSDNNYGIYKDTATNKWSSYKLSHGTPATWPLHNISKDVSCNKCHNTTSVFNGTIAPAFATSVPGYYVGNSSACGTCHPEAYAYWRNTSHTSKIITRTDAQARGYPAPPNGDGNWSNISYAIGGHWKVRYVDNYGYILTNGTVDGRTSGGPGKTQYNVATQTWSHYNRNVTKAYICGHCHTTGYIQNNVSSSTMEPWKTLRQLGVYPEGVLNNSLAPGFTGWWAENNIGCEACHGQGGDHVNNPSKDNIRNASYVRENPAICGDCHSRPDTGEYETLKQYPDGVSDTLLNDTLYDSSPMPTVDYSKVGGHHEQWEDWKASYHSNKSVTCVTCHGGHNITDPAYAGGPTGKIKFLNGTVYPAVVNTTCTSCHLTATRTSFHRYYNSSTQCITCHMPKNRKSSDIIDLRSHWIGKNLSVYGKNKNGEIHGYNFPNFITINRLFSLNVTCNKCHGTYNSVVGASSHNRTKNPSAPACTDCHKTGYTTEVINNLTTCINCHANGVNGFYQRHTSTADCTQCHFGNTTQRFSLNSSRFTHNHSLTIEHNFYEYNISGMPLRTNGGVGVGTFPYYTCTLTCHRYNATTGVEGIIDEAGSSWLQSKHAQSFTGSETNSCAKCKSPPNYNVSAPSSAKIAQADWQGIQCRVCHNLHDRRFPNNTGPRGFPIAFYNSTKSSRNGYATYDQVTSATQLCENCHTGTTHDSKFAGTHKNSAGFNCTDCHMNSTFNNELHLFEVKNTTSGVTGCKVCHDAAHSSFSSYQYHDGKVECWACHDQTITNRNATNYSVSSDRNYGIYKDTTTNILTTYKLSHGAPATWPLHNITKNITCTKCHGARSLYGGLAPGFGGDFTYTTQTTDPLISGYNLVAIGLIPDPSINARDILLTSSGGIPGVTKVIRWNSSAQQWEGYEYITADGVYIGSNFAMEGYKGYFIKGNASTVGQTYTFKGRK